MAAKALLNSTQLLKLFRYDPSTGALHFRERGPEWFCNSGRGGAAGNAARWNGRFAEKRAGYISLKEGYVQLNLPRLGGGTDQVLAHRVAWCMTTGSWPKNQIDHRNHRRADNRFSNLREATNVQNARNQSLMSHNTSGVCGVYWDQGVGKWCAQIIVDGVRHYLGAHQEKEGATAARLLANVRFGFAAEHGQPLLS